MLYKHFIIIIIIIIIIIRQVKTSDIISWRFGDFMTLLSRVQMRIKLTNASSRITTDLHSRGATQNPFARSNSVSIVWCNLCDTGSYVDNTRGHLYARYDNSHAGAVPEDLLSCFKVLKKCMSKFDCLVNEMLYIKQLTPSLNVQTDSIRAKVFV